MYKSSLNRGRLWIKRYCRERDLLWIKRYCRRRWTQGSKRSQTA